MKVSNLSWKLTICHESYLSVMKVTYLSWKLTICHESWKSVMKVDNLSWKLAVCHDSWIYVIKVDRRDIPATSIQWNGITCQQCPITYPTPSPPVPIFCEENAYQGIARTKYQSCEACWFHVLFAISQSSHLWTSRGNSMSCRSHGVARMTLDVCWSARWSALRQNAALHDLVRNTKYTRNTWKQISTHLIP